MPTDLTQDETGFFSLMVQVWGLTATVAFTPICHRRKWALAISPVLMFIVNFTAQVLLADGGPDACAGAIILPIYDFVAFWLTLRLVGSR